MEHITRQMLQYPGNHGIIFRRVYPSLEKSVIPRMKDKLHGIAQWNGSQRRFTFPNRSILELGHMQRDDDKRVYQGGEYGCIFFEEVTEFLESQYTYMLHRLRPPDLSAGMRPHVIATTNPGGVGHAWVKRRFVKPRPEDIPAGTDFKHSVPWRPAPTEDQPEPGLRVFIPATMEDNPLLMEKDPGYKSRVRAISDRALRKAMETGDWDIIDQVDGALWQRSWLEMGRVRKLPTTPIRRLVALDPSDGAEATSGDEFGVWGGCMGADGVVYTEFSDGWVLSTGKMARQAVTLAKDLRADGIVVERNHGGKWLRLALLTADRSANVIEVWASHGKLTRAEPVAALFDPATTDDGTQRARMVGYHEILEDQMTHFTGVPGELSPNRMDAMVWGHHRLALSGASGPGKVRRRGQAGQRSPRATVFRGRDEYRWMTRR